LVLAETPRLEGVSLDAGCGVGRASFALAERGAELVLGVDLNFAMLRLASEVLRHGTVRYPRRQVGLVYERREFPASFANQERVDFWACDVAALPFPDQTFSFAASMNVLDCVYAPRELLVSLGRVLKPRGKTVLACPYDWSPAATPVESWLGGHSQRSPMAGSCEAVLRSLLTPCSHPSSIETLRLAAERDDLPWHVRLHERSAVSYKVHLVIAERVSVQ
jgi:SAM-dependent methyltransferase